MDLDDATVVDRLVAEVRTSITGEPEPRLDQLPDPDQSPSRATDGPGAQLRAALIDTLKPFLGHARHLFLAPDGDLLRLPFEVLPEADGRLLTDHFAISYLSVARDLVRLATQSRQSNGPPLVLAAPDFDVGAGLGDDPGQPFEPLPGTALEGVRIASMLGVRALLGGEAVKSALFTNHAPRILHVATHGFVLREGRPRLTPEGIPTWDDGPPQLTRTQD